MSTLHILEIRPLSEVSLAFMFSNTVGSLFILMLSVGTLLVGIQTGVATVENSMEFPQKTKNGTAL